MRLVLADSFFATSNYIEAGLWIAIGVGFVIHAIMKRGNAISVIAAVTFFAFGLSDIIEAGTGAWWRPWWLLVLKGLCVAVFLALLRRYVAARRRESRGPDIIPRTAHRAASSRPSP
jgi:hypothetical protein